MANDLSELTDRIDWSRTKINELSEHILNLINGGAFQGLEIPELTTGRKRMVARQVKELPNSIRIETGSIVHELRATLDGLASTLAIRNGNPSKKVYFPISKNETVFRSDGMRKIRDLSQADQTLIAALNPFDEGNPLLFALHTADLTRKHNRLITTAHSTGDLSIGPGDIMGGSDIGGGGEISVGRDVTVARLGAGSNVRISVAVNVCFGEPEHIAGKPIIPVLNDFAGLVESIVKVFD